MIKKVKIKKETSIKDRVKKYFTAKPKGDFWMWAFFYLLIFRYLSPLMLILSSFMMVGLIAPESDISPTIEKVSQSLTEVLMNIGQTMFEVGQSIAINNPIISKIIFIAFANFIWVFYVAFLTILIQMIRYFISWMIRKEKNE